MLLILGDSYAERARQACRLGTGTEARGWRGARINNDDFRRWAVEVMHRLRPSDVLLIIGGNDVAAPQFSPRVFGELFQELILGLCICSRGPFRARPADTAACHHPPG